MEEFYEKIEQYLVGSMTAEAKLEFEKELQSNPELAAELALHRQIHDAFADPKELALRSSLQQIQTELDQASPSNSKKPFYQNSWFYIGVIATLLVIYLLSRQQNTASFQPKESIQDSLQQPSLDSTKVLPKIDSTSLQGTENVEAPVQVPPRPPAVATKDPFASNQTLEALLDPAVRNRRYDFELNANLVELDEGNNLIIDGILITTKLAEERFIITVFDNRNQSYPASPLLSQPVTPREISEDQPVAFGGKLKYAVLLDEVIEDLEPGLYYYQVRLEGEAQPLYTGTFRKE